MLKKSRPNLCIKGPTSPLFASNHKTAWYPGIDSNYNNENKNNMYAPISKISNQFEPKTKIRTMEGQNEGKYLITIFSGRSIFCWIWSVRSSAIRFAVPNNPTSKQNSWSSVDRSVLSITSCVPRTKECMWHYCMFTNIWILMTDDLSQPTSDFTNDPSRILNNFKWLDVSNISSDPLQYYRQGF